YQEKTRPPFARFEDRRRRLDGALWRSESFGRVDRTGPKHISRSSFAPDRHIFLDLGTDHEMTLPGFGASQRPFFGSNYEQNLSDTCSRRGLYSGCLRRQGDKAEGPGAEE